MDTRVVAIISTFNEEDIIAQVIEDLIRQRVSVFVLDNGSTDRTAEESAPFLGRGMIGFERFPAGAGSGPECYEWERILERKANLAQELEADWFIHHDADEFREGPWANLDLAGSIEQVDRFGYNAIDFELLNFWPTHDTFKPKDDIREAFHFYESGQEWDKIQIRCWKKTASPVDLVSTGGHEVIFPGRRVFPLRFVLRHYPIRGQAHGLRKVFQERRPRFLASERSRGWHVQYDQIERDHSFIRDPSTMTRFDPDLVRLNLVLHHRGVEELEGAPETDRRIVEQSRRYEATVEQELNRLNRDVERLERELDGGAHRIAALDSRLDVANRRAISLEHAVDVAQREAHSLEEALDVAQREAHSLEEALDVAQRSAQMTSSGLNTRNLEVEALQQAAHQSNLLIQSLHSQLAEQRHKLAQTETALSQTADALEAIRASRIWRWSAWTRR